MSLKVQYEFLFAGRDEGSFLENYAYEVNENRGGAGHVFVCLEIQNNPSEAEAMGEGIFAALKTTFFEDSEAEGYVRFENSLKAINQRISDFRKGKLQKHIGVVHAIVAAVENGSLYLSQCGDSEAYLIRKHFVSIVSEGLYDHANKDGDLFTSIANGDLEPGDFVLFCTTRLLRYITKIELSRMVLASNVQRTLSDLRDALSGEILGRIGFVGVGTTLITDRVMERGADGLHDEEYGERDQDTLSVSRGEKMNVMAFTGPIMEKAKKYQQLMMNRLRGAKIFEKIGIFEKTGGVGRFAGGVKERLSMREGLNKDKILVAFVAVIILLTGGVWFVRHNQIKNAELLTYDQKLQEARQLVSDAQSQGQVDKKAAGTLLQSAEDKAKEVLNSGEYRDKSRGILTLVQQTRDQLDNIKHVTAPKVIADLSSKGGSSNLGMIAGKDRTFVYDAEKVFEVILDKVQDPVKFEPNEAVISGVYFDQLDQPIFFSKSGKLYSYNNGVIRPMVAQEGSFRKGVQIVDWGSRVYMLDPVSDQIWKYPFVKSTGVFGSAEGYKTAGKLGNGVSLTIDSNVYVLNNDGTISRYYGGVDQNMQIDKAPFSAMVKPSKIYTDNELNQVFVLDGNRVFVYGKDPKTQNLVYQYQIAVDGIDELRDMYFDKNTSKFYLLDAKKIYEVMP